MTNLSRYFALFWSTHRELARPFSIGRTFVESISDELEARLTFEVYRVSKRDQSVGEDHPRDVWDWGTVGQDTVRRVTAPLSVCSTEEEPLEQIVEQGFQAKQEQA